MSEPLGAPSRRHRLEVRVTPEQDALIRQAADLEETTVTTFVLETVTTRAKRVVKQHRTSSCRTRPSTGSSLSWTGQLSGCPSWSSCSSGIRRSPTGEPPGVRLERLDAHHDVSEFDSGNEELDGWLRRHALRAPWTARTFVLT